MTGDHPSGPAAETGYAGYMRTDELLSLQRTPAQWVHPDELLFQTVHQVTELWLKLACCQIDTAARQVRAGRVGPAELLVGRASLAVRLVTEDLEMLRRLAPSDFQLIRPQLGTGSGFESPGWCGLRRASRQLGRAFSALLADANVDLLGLYRADPVDPLYRLAEAMVDLDERVAIWRAQHYTLATRIIGPGSTGTKGTPVDTLSRLIGQKLFPELWQVRSDLTAAAAGPQ